MLQTNTLWKQTHKLQEFIRKHPHLNTLNEHDMAHIYQSFIDCLIDHNHLYYIESTPIISDREYDELFSYLKKIEEYFPHIISSNSPTQNLIWQLKIQEWFQKATHTIPLLSLENSYNAKDLKDREEKNLKILQKSNDPNLSDIIHLTYTIEPKFDGISVELIYNRWKLVQAITRGDGQTGEDITINAKTIKNLPHNIDFQGTLHVRWEIMMPKSQLQQLNNTREKNKETPFANTRNAASWSIKLLDTNIVSQRGLVCYVYDILNKTDINKIWNKTEIEININQALQNPSAKLYHSNKNKNSLELLKNLWLPVFELKNIKAINNNIKEVIKICEDSATQQYLEDQDLSFDWLVIKIVDNNIRAELWQTAHHPRRAIAYKFPAQQISAQIISVDFQVGRTGIITPVANLKPVQLSGVNISRVSLHNFDFITYKDIHRYDYVRLQRSGEVIPYITSIIKERRDTKQIQTIQAPQTCPSCNQTISKIDMHYYCTNSACPAQIKEKLIHFASKDCINIEWIWISLIDILVDQKIINNFADLYKITDPNIKLKIQWIPWLGNKKLFEIQQQLQASKNKDLRRLINALGIPWVGKKIAKDIVSAFHTQNIKIQTFKDFINQLSNKEFLNNIHGIWEKIIIWITDYLQINKEILEQLNKVGLNFTNINNTNDHKTTTKHTAKHFAITWSFPISRTQIIEQFELQWAIFDAQPTQNTHFILVGEKPWNKKTKAEELWIKIYVWREQIKEHFQFLWWLTTQKQENKNNNQPEQIGLF